jgi:hypothetical protein
VTFPKSWLGTNQRFVCPRKTVASCEAVRFVLLNDRGSLIHKFVRARQVAEGRSLHSFLAVKMCNSLDIIAYGSWSMNLYFIQKKGIEEESSGDRREVSLCRLVLDGLKHVKRRIYLTHEILSTYTCSMQEETKAFGLSLRFWRRCLSRDTLFHHCYMQLLILFDR